MGTMKMNSKRTAITRKKASRPLQAALELDAVKGKVLDYGCGKGHDVTELHMLGFKASRYDPNFFPRKPRGRFQTVLMTYVVNVLQPTERNAAILDAWKYVKKGGRLIVTSHTDTEIKRQAIESGWVSYACGFITGTGTYQRGYSTRQLERLVLVHLPNVRNVQTGPSNAGGAMVIVLKE